jgi:ketosteroid isomerase-like protein
MRVSVYGDTAVVTGLEKMKGTYKGAFGQFTVCFTNVFVRRDGRWQLVAHQSTEVRSL